MANILHPSPGGCIYCENPAVGDEHIIPESLGGDHVIELASCRKHEGCTAAVEQHVAQKVFGILRTQLDLPSKRRTRIDEHEVYIKSGAIDGLVSVATQNTPRYAMLPIYDEPGILVGREPVDGISGTGVEFVLSDLSKLNELSIEVSGGVLFPLEVEVRTFARFLAKIAHCYVIATYGTRYGEFEPFLIEIIEGTDLRTGYFVGSAGAHWSPVTSIGPHRIAARHADGLLIVYIRLFATIWRTSQLYQVVAGRLSQRV